LGRFIVSAVRLDEFRSELERIDIREPWRVSAIIGADVEIDSEAIREFNSEVESRAIIDVVEVKAATSEEVRRIHPMLPPSATPYFEVPAEVSTEQLNLIGSLGARAKIRTGGVVESAFPAAERIAQFIIRCAESKVAFKATAGLHHPLRCVKPLTYEVNAPKGTMHGFLNVFLAACAYGGLGEQVDRRYREQVRTALLAILLNETPTNFTFRDDKATMRGMLTETSHGVDRNSNYELSVSTEVIRHARENFAIAFGSCSFEEPIKDLRSIHFL